MRFFLSILGVILFVVIIIVIIASSGSKPNIKAINLDSFNNPNTSLTQTTTGQLVGDESRRAIKIVITQNQRTISILSGYNQTVTSTETYYNNAAAYGVFLGAMQNANYTSSRNTNEVNMFGVCPLGNTFQYQANSPTKTVSNLWSTSCSFQWQWTINQTTFCIANT